MISWPIPVLTQLGKDFQLCFFQLNHCEVIWPSSQPQLSQSPGAEGSFCATSRAGSQMTWDGQRKGDFIGFKTMVNSCGVVDTTRIWVS